MGVKDMHVERFIEELFNPDMKCKRVGHDMKEYHRVGYYDGGGFRSVATKVTQCRRVCRRCGHADEDWKTIREQGIQSLSGPPELMHEIYNSDSNNPCWVDYW